MTETWLVLQIIIGAFGFLVGSHTLYRTDHFNAPRDIEILLSCGCVVGGGILALFSVLALVF